MNNNASLLELECGCQEADTTAQCLLHTTMLVFSQLPVCSQERPACVTCFDSHNQQRPPFLPLFLPHPPCMRCFHTQLSCSDATHCFSTRASKEQLVRVAGTAYVPHHHGHHRTASVRVAALSKRSTKRAHHPRGTCTTSYMLNNSPRKDDWRTCRMLQRTNVKFIRQYQK